MFRRHVCAMAIAVLAAHPVRAQPVTNALLGQWELNGEDGFIRYEGKIHCDVVALRFTPTSVSIGRGPLAAPVFGAPIPVVYGFSGPLVFVSTASVGGNTIDYRMTSNDEMALDSYVGCTYRRLGSNAPSLAQHEIAQALQRGQPVDHRVDDPAPGPAPLPSGPPPVMSYDESMKAIGN
jgi:hypothetical protein